MLKFQWDEAKNTLNKRKHKLSFELATEIFSDPHLLTQLDDRENYGEDCWQSIGNYPTVSPFYL